MEYSDLLSRLEVFFSEVVYNQLLNAVQNRMAIVIDFSDIEKFDVDVADTLFESPTEFFKAADEAVRNVDVGEEIESQIPLRIKGLPDTQNISIKNLRSKHLKKFVAVDGIIKQASEVRPEIILATFECRACGERIMMLQEEQDLATPYMCECGNKRGFEMVERKMVDIQRLEIEECPENLEGSAQARKIGVFIKNDLVDPKFQKRVAPGSKVVVTGILEDIPIKSDKGKESKRRDIYIDGNYIEPIEFEFADIELSPEDIIKIKELAENPKIYEMLVDSIAPSIYGYKDIKEAIAMQLFGGVRKVRPDGVTTRGDIHILLVGDPGSGKCVAGDTKIVLEDGSVTTIGKSVNDVLGDSQDVARGECFKKTNHDLLSMNLDGKIECMKATGVWKREAPKYLYKIKTYCGRSITATAEHPFFITRNANIVAKSAKDLTTKDFIAAPRALKINGSVQKIKLQIKRTAAKNGVHIKFPDTADERFARFIGYLVGDGHAYFNQTSAIISLTNNNDEILSDFSELLPVLFAVNPTKRGPHKGKSAKEVYACSIELGEFLRGFDETLLKRAKHKRIPTIIMKSPNNVLKELLRSYFECEAHINGKKRVIEVLSASKDLAEDVQIALLRFGIVSQMCSGMKCATNCVKKTMRRYWRVSISGEMVDKFASCVGFISREKTDKLNDVIQKKVKNNTNIHVIPCDSLLLSSLRKMLKMKQRDFKMSRSTYEHYDIGDRNPARDNLLTVVKAFEERFREVKDQLSEKDAEFAYVKIKQLRMLSEADVFWDRVADIKKIKAPDKWVYDFEVGDVHNFVANNLFVHNSQILKYTVGLAPKARYVVGKSTSGAGLTATVVKDEFMRGWALEAGALVLANKGLVAIDELDKMSQEDRSAMHEVAEQQCYHPDTEIILSDGRSVKIGQFVDKLMTENRHAVYEGRDCEILPVEGVEIQTTDMKRVFRTKVNRVSRHKAPKKMYKVTYSNGRHISVTPEHPTFVFSGGKVIEKRADEITAGMMAPAPLCYRTNPNEKVALEVPERWHHNLKDISFPEVLDARLARFLGYLASEGHSYRSVKNRYAEIGVTNSDVRILDDVRMLYSDIFNITPNTLVQAASGNHRACDVLILRCPSQLMYEFFELNFPEVMDYSAEKAVPQKIRVAAPEMQLEFLRAMFLGDGFVDQQRFGYVTSSFELAKGIQDILLNNAIWSYIATDIRPRGAIYKIVVSTKESMKRFRELVVAEYDKRLVKIEKLVERSKSRLNSTDVVPAELVRKLYNALKEYRTLDGYFNKILEKKQNSNRDVVKKYLIGLEKRLDEVDRLNIEAEEAKTIRDVSMIPVDVISCKLGVSAATIYNIENNRNHESYNLLFSVVKDIAGEKLDRMCAELKVLRDFVFSDVRLVSVKNVEAIENHGLEWVYDVTVEPTKTFISEGLVLHNTVTISKANIQATLHAQTTILAAANPKFGRFDPYQSIPEQIDIPDTLLSRFDLIFPIRDEPNKEKDTLLVRHILKMHENPDDQHPPLDGAILRKYISYAKSNVNPKLTKAAENAIETFYVGLRSKYSGTEEVSSVPIGARQLEALIRLSEASARVRLSLKVKKEDADRAIRLLTDCLMKVGIDPETGKFDIDRLESGTTSSQRNKIRIILTLIGEMQNESPDKAVLIEDVKAAAEEQGIEDADDIIEKLRREGELFSPKGGYIRKV